ALWMSVSVAERTVPAHCPEHDPLAAAMATMAHHGPGGHAPGGGHHCTCLEDCCGAAAMLVPAAGVRHDVPLPLLAAPPAVDRGEPAPARSGTRLPFANGPPHALAA
ncbi:MAG TPA: hypothetical protein VMT93_10240, partial [Gemmatimonadaceae bacterium]|nr:hypothetical protein [Gemmatimonadaceae bacterium]